MKLKWAKARHETDIPDAHIVSELNKESKKSKTREQAFIMPESSYEDCSYELPQEDETNVIIIEF